MVKKKLSYDAPTLSQKDKTRDTTAFAIVWFLLVGATLAYFARSYSSVSAEQCELYGDYPFLGLRTFSASNYNLLEGPYSRFNFSHPSPLVFYFYALIDSLLPFPGHYRAERLGQIILNCLCLTLAANTVVRSVALHPLICFLIVGVPLIYFAPAASPFVAVDFWNPSSLIIPSMSFAIGLQAYMAGDRKSALTFGFSAALLLGQHLGTASIALLGFFTLTMIFVGNPKRKPETGQEVLALVFPSGLAVLPIILDGVMNGKDSNLARIGEHLLKKSPLHHDFSNIYKFTTEQLLTTPALFVLCSIGVLLLWLSVKNKQARICCVILLLVTAITLFGIRYSPTRLQPYLFFPLYGFWAYGTVQALLILTSMILQDRPDPGYVPPFVFVTALLLIISPPSLSSVFSAPCKNLRWLPAIKPHIRGRIVSIGAHKMHGWDQAGALAYSLRQNGHRFCFLPKFRKYVTEDMICSKVQIRRSLKAVFSRQNAPLQLEGELLSFDKLDPRFELHLAQVD